MKLTLSKQQWQHIGAETGWTKTAKMAIAEALTLAAKAWEQGNRDEALKLLRQFDPELTENDLERAVQGVKPRFLAESLLNLLKQS